MSPSLEIILIACAVAVACSLVGTFLVLRQMAMMSDAISHSILPGIVVAFFLTNDLNSPLLLGAAAATGVLTVLLVELLFATGRVKEDAAIGIVFPVLFSIGVILIARYAGDVHLDTDAVLLGELAFAPFDRLIMFGQDLGPRSLFVMAAVGALNVSFLAIFYKELKLATFDAALAAALGFAPVALHYGLMTLVSVTAVAAFDAVGSILVVALMIGPPATAYLMTDRLGVMLVLSVAIGAASAVAGFWLASWLDASIAGAMASMIGGFFMTTYLFAPGRGVVASLRRHARHRWVFAEKMLTIHLLHHEGLPEAAEENRIDHLEDHLSWDPVFARRVVRRAVADRLVRRTNDHLVLTDEGRALAREAIVQT
jgi:manganese/zinc/iron transport system permease protein